MTMLLRNAPLALLTILAACSGQNGDDIACTPPLPGWNKPHPHLGSPSMQIRIALPADGKIRVDGMPATLPELEKKLVSVRGLSPSPIVTLETEMGIGCAAFHDTRSTIDRVICKAGGHCDEGIQTLWEAIEVGGPIP